MHFILPYSTVDVRHYVAMQGVRSADIVYVLRRNASTAGSLIMESIDDSGLGWRAPGDRPLVGLLETEFGTQHVHLYSFIFPLLLFSTANCHGVAILSEWLRMRGPRRLPSMNRLRLRLRQRKGDGAG